MARPPDVRVLVHPSGWEGSVVIATTPLNAGNSGGPLINSMGQVIGTNSWVLTGDFDPQDWNVAVAHRALCKELVDWLSICSVN